MVDRSTGVTEGPLGGPAVTQARRASRVSCGLVFMLGRGKKQRRTMASTAIDPSTRLQATIKHLVWPLRVLANGHQVHERASSLLIPPIVLINLPRSL